MPIPPAILGPALPALAVATLLLTTKTYWLLPLKMRQRTIASGVPTPLEPVPDETAFPIDLQMPLNRHRLALEAMGFVGTPIMRDGSGRLKAALQMLEHPSLHDVATLIVAPRKTDPEPHVGLSFTSRLADGAYVVTSNDPLGSVFPTRPEYRHAARFPGETNAKRLHALHRAHVERAGRQVPLKLGSAVAWQRNEEQRAFAWWQECGFARKGADGLRYTVKGAYLAAWKLQNPWKGRILARDEKLRQELLAAAGLPAA